jgi:hypothetical protein
MFAIRCKRLVWEQFKEMGRYWISSTEMPSVLHASHFMSRKKLFEKKLGRWKKPTRGNPAIQHGIANEGEALLEGKRFVEKKLGRDVEWRRPSLVLDPWSVLSCSPDQISEDFGLEVKCPWKRALPDRKEQILDDYLIQCFVCAHVCKLDKWYLFYWNTYTRESRCFLVRENKELWEKVKRHAQDFVEILKKEDEKEGNRAKGRKDRELWAGLREELLLGVERIPD